MRQHLGYGQRRAGYTSIAFEVAGFAGPIAAGLVSDRFFAARRPPVIVLMMLCLSASSLAFNRLSAAGPIANIVGLALLGFFIHGPDSVVSGVAAVDYGGANAGAAAGLVNSLGSVGAALSGSLVGRIERTSGWAAVFNLFAPLSLAGALLTGLLWWRPGGARRPPAAGAAP
jgi:sugar phosphate permease